MEPRAAAWADEPLTAGIATGAGRSAAAWPAIFAGAFVAAAASVLLIALGAGLGFASISPWPGHGASATAFTMSAAIWLIVTQWISASLGGYIAGRLRTRWVGTHTHEVFFRDTAHGLVTWSVATVLVALALSSSLSSLFGNGARAAGETVGAAVSGPSPALTYAMDKLFRPEVTAEFASSAPLATIGTSPGPAVGSGASSSGAAGSAAPGVGGAVEGINDPRLEAAHIIVNGTVAGRVPDGDRAYLAQLVATHTGASPAEAQRRVDDFIASATLAETQARAAADAARKSAAEASIYTALAMLIGAFIASVSAALGGRLRDLHP